MRKIPVTLAGGQTLLLAPGAHSALIQQVLAEFAPRFAPGAEVIYIGDTGERTGYGSTERLVELGAAVDPQGKMPDAVLYYADRNWLLLIECVTSHGPVDAQRRRDGLSGPPSHGALFARRRVGDRLDEVGEDAGRQVGQWKPDPDLHRIWTGPWMLPERQYNLTVRGTVKDTRRVFFGRPHPSAQSPEALGQILALRYR